MIRTARTQPAHASRRWWLLLLAALAPGVALAPGAALAQPADPRFAHLSLEDGLSQNDVTSIAQDALGFLWFGTEDGLNRYDGYELATFKPVPFDTTSLGDTWINGLARDGRGGLWITTRGAGLLHYDARAGTFSPAPVRTGDPISNDLSMLLRGDDGVLWLGSRYDGLYRYDPATAHAIRYRHDPNDPASLSSDEVSALLEDRHGDVWVGTATGGINRLDSATGTFTHYRYDPNDPFSVEGDAVQALLEDRSGTLWIGTDRGLGRLNRETRTVEPVPAWAARAPDGARVQALLEDPDGVLWIGTNRGLGRLDPDTGTLTTHRHDPTDPASLGSDGVRSLFLDRTGTFWVGTDRGVSAFAWPAPAFDHLTHDPDDPNSLDDPDVWSLLVDREGILWVGTSGGLNRVDRTAGGPESGSGRRVTRYTPDPSDPTRLASGLVMGLYEARDGTFWVASRPGGLHLFDRETGTVLKRYTWDSADSTSLRNENPWWILEDERGDFWITSGGVGCMAHMDRSTETFTPHCHDPDDPDTPSHDFGRYLIEGHSGDYWLATWGGGLGRIDPETGTYTHYRHDPDDPNTPAEDIILSLYQDPGGILWLGFGSAGLDRFDPETGTFTHFHEGNSGLPNNTVVGIQGDDAGHLWLSTFRGLTRFTPATGTFQTYGVEDGLQHLEFNSGASHRTPSGELFFGGINGFNAFFPDRVTDNPFPPPVVITEVNVDDRPLVPGEGRPLEQAAPMAEAVRLGPAQRDIAFTFAALHFAAPEHNRYRYHLDGYDRDWHEVGTQRTATYTNLDPGTYTFRVQAANSDGLWNEDGAALALTVVPYFYETWWFYALCGLAALGLAGTALRYRLRQHRRHEQMLEAQVAERTSQLRAEKQKTEAQAERLREVDSLKSRFFTNVSHEFRTPLTLTIGPLEDLEADADALPAPAQQRVDLALRNSRRLLRLINQLLDVARLEAGEMRLTARRQDLADHVRSLALSFVPLAERRHVRFAVHTPEAPVPVFFDADKLEQVVVNLLSNAFKFTPEGGAIQVEVRVDEGQTAEVAVRDSGPGIPAADLPHLFDRFYRVDETAGQHVGSGIGLSLAKDLAELHGGTLTIESTPGFGATFTVRLPLGRAHLTDDQLALDPTYADHPGSDVLGGDGRAEPPPTLAPSPDPVAAGETPDLDDTGDDRTAVLVADDNADIRAYVRAHLSSRYRVLEAADGDGALALARSETPDLVVSDVMMPGLDGVGLVRALKSDRETDFIPVVLLTARAEEADVQAGLDAGADDYVVKPFNVRTLQARIENLIASRRKLRERFAEAGGLPPVPEPAAAEQLAATDAAFVARARAAVETRLDDEELTVEDLAEALEQSRSTLHRRLRQLVHQTPTTFVRRIRLEHAASLLLAREGTISEVAYAVGFKSVSHFSQSFRKCYGVSPSAYQDQHLAV